MKSRCAWCGSDPLYIAYHDNQWGVPVHDDRLLFEMLILEGAQAGLSWLTILKKRENYRRAFHDFDPAKIAAFSQDEILGLLQDAGIVRNRLKIEATVKNARGVMGIIEEYGSLSAFLWRYVDNKPRQNAWESLTEVPPKTAESVMMSRDLKKRGFNFVGPTICYAFMQAVGMV
ncbi:MAG: DNA-3-methyladenine glycosylase I, partial [Proteobacteria bacterium]|nr:DNA-3-methyladenine glycosylase I [Pseudomonadota bacterium]